MCGEEKLIKHFSKRTELKKDGSLSFSSWCKKCSSSAQNKRIKKQRAEKRLEKEENNKFLGIKKVRGVSVDKKRISSKFLKRGTIHYEGHIG